MKKILLITTITLSIILFGLFSSKANEISKPYIAKLIESNIDKNMSVEILEYKLDYDYITLFANINKENHIKVYGKIDTLSKSFDLNYTIDAIDKLIKTKNINIPSNTKIYGNIKSQIDGQIAYISGLAKSDIANLSIKNAELNLSSMELFSEFILDIEELKKVKFITQKNLNGKLRVTGELTKKDKEILIKGTTDSFDGKIDFILKNSNLYAEMNEVSIKKLFKTLNYPLVFSAPLLGKVIYNLKSKKGTIDSTLKNARLVENRLTNSVKKFSGIDLTKDVYNQTTFNAKLYPKKIEFKLLAKNKKNIISIYDATLKQKNRYIDGKYKINIRKRDIEGHIKGDIKSPHITVDGSKFIKKEIKNVLDKYIDKDNQEQIKSQLKEFGIDKKDTKKAINKASNFIKGFF